MVLGPSAVKACSPRGDRRPGRRWPSPLGKASLPSLAFLCLAAWYSLGSSFAAPNTRRVAGVDEAAAELAKVRAAPDPEPGRLEEKRFSPGQAMTGIVKRVLDNGIIIKTQGVDGFAHVSKLCEGYVGHPGEVVEEGDQVTCRVIRHEGGRLELTLRELGDKDLMRDFKNGQQLNGTVVAVCGAGADVNIGASKYAFLHKSQIQDGVWVNDAREYLQKGDKVKVWVKTKDVKKKSLRLTMIESQLERKSIAKGLSLEKLVPGTELGGEVRGVTSFGVFVNVGAEADGLIHVKRINDGMVTDLPKLFQRGDKVVVRVFSLNRGKLELELVGAPNRLPGVEIFQLLEGEMVNAKVERRVPDAFLVSVSPPEGGAPVLAKLPIAPGDGMMLSEGDVTRVKIVGVDVQKRQLSLLDPAAPAPAEAEAEPEPPVPAKAAAAMRSYGNL